MIAVLPERIAVSIHIFKFILERIGGATGLIWGMMTRGMDYLSLFAVSRITSMT